jgi:hypothetical protein
VGVPAHPANAEMRRKFLHQLWTALAALSLLSCARWVRSQQFEDAVRVVSPRGERYAIGYSTMGQMMVGFSRVSPGPSAWPAGIHYHAEGEPGPLEDGPLAGLVFDRWGFGMRAEQPPYVVAEYAVWCPHWFAMLLLLVLPARWLVPRVVRRGRARRGLCNGCGYDLRGTPERCPECGAVPAKAPVA